MSGAADPLLLLDLGNRHAKFARPGLAAVRRVPLEPDRPRETEQRLAEELSCCAPGERVLLSCVAPRWRDPVVALLRGRGADLREVGAGDLPLRVASRGTGVDRLLGAWWAHQEAGGAALVASLGTAFTLDAVDAAGCFRGGAIGAGLGVQEAALASAAPHLPPPGREATRAGIPDDSASAIACGTAGALAAALEVLASRFAEELHAAACPRFLTGGDAARLARWLAPDWRLEADLVLRGLDRLAPRVQALPEAGG